MRWGLSKGEENARVVLTDTSQVPITLLQQSHFTAYSCRLNNRHIVTLIQVYLRVYVKSGLLLHDINL